MNLNKTKLIASLVCVIFILLSCVSNRSNFTEIFDTGIILQDTNLKFKAYGYAGITFIFDDTNKLEFTEIECRFLRVWKEKNMKVYDIWKTDLNSTNETQNINYYEKQFYSYFYPKIDSIFKINKDNVYKNKFHWDFCFKINDQIY